MKIEESAVLNEERIKQEKAIWNPRDDPNATEDPLKTLFVARLSYETSEQRLRREMEAFGPVRRVRLVFDKTTGKSRGYSFVEFEHESDMKKAYKYADGKKIDGRRVLVDVERGRTIRGWLPRRLGGGRGSTRKAKPPQPKGRKKRRLDAAAASAAAWGGGYGRYRGAPPPRAPPSYPVSSGRYHHDYRRRDY